MSADGRNAHAGQCSNNSTSTFIDDSKANGLPIRVNGNEKGVYIVGFGSVRYGKEIELGVKGWTFRVDRADPTTKTQLHVHISGPKDQHWSQNEDGSPHDKNKNNPGSPPNSKKKELKKQIKWDWDAKHKQYNETHKFVYFISESEMVYFSTVSDYNSFRFSYESGLIEANGYNGSYLYYLNGIPMNMSGSSFSIPIKFPRPVLIP